MKDDLRLVILGMRGSVSLKHGSCASIMFCHIIRNNVGGLVRGTVIDHDDAIYEIRHRRYHVNDLFFFIVGRDNHGNGLIVQHSATILAGSSLRNGSVIQEW